ncbi:hypothetical protein C823_007902 [Eubacterium plexicaudatum ASF492]|nr:hypothetical protein C823_007902 [Eubacterium plexicaudatum ASF492]
MKNNNIVCVVALDKNTGWIKTCTSCDKEDSQNMQNTIEVLDIIQRLLPMKN